MSATLHFERSEYDNRIARTRAAMERAGVELMLASDPSNMAWLTGYDGWSFYVHQNLKVHSIKYSIITKLLS